MRKDIHAYYRALGLSEGVGPAEIRRAYRQLVQVWHPDLFKPGSVMQMTAEDITKEINEAYEQLYRKKLYRRFVPKAAGTDAGAASGDAAGGGGEPPDGEGDVPSEDNRPRRPARRRGRQARRSSDWLREGLLLVGNGMRAILRVPWGKFALALGLGAVIFSIGPRGLESPRRASTMAPAQANLGSKDTLAPLPAQAGPANAGTRASRKERAHERAEIGLGVAADPTLRRLTPADSISEAPVAGAALDPADSSRLFRRAEALLEVFDVGDSKARVLAVQGAPDDAGESVFRYGSSLVYFENGRVSGWSDRLPWLRVRGWALSGAESLDTFSLGSTRGEVIRAQGVPSDFSARGYYYGSSYVLFENDVVAGWGEGDVNLRSFDIPRLPFVELGYLALR